MLPTIVFLFALFLGSLIIWTAYVESKEDNFKNYEFALTLIFIDCILWSWLFYLLH